MALCTHTAHMLILTLLTLFLFGPSINHQLVWDDHMFIERWPVLESWSNWPQLLKGDLPPENGRLVYRPLRSLLYLINFQLFGTNPLPYRVQAIAIQLAMVVLVYLTLVKLTRAPAASLLGAALFAVHPANLETTLFTASSLDVPGLIFFLLAFLSYLYHVPKSQILTPIAYTLAILFNELALTLPLIIWLHRHLFSPKFKFSYLPMILSLISYFIFRSALLDAPTINPIYYGVLDRLKIVALVLVTSLTKLVWPHPFTVNPTLIPGLTAQSPYDLIGLTPPSLPSWPLLLIIGLIILLRRLRHDPWLNFSLAWIILTLLPVLQLTPTNTLFTYRYLYLPSFGLCLLLTYVLIKLKRKFLCYLVACCLLPVAIYTKSLVPIWQSDFTLWSNAYRYTQKSPAVLVNLGLAHVARGDFNSARQLFASAIAANPHLPSAKTNLSIIQTLTPQ